MARIWTPDQKERQSLLMKKRWADKAKYDGIKSDFESAYLEANNFWFPYLMQAQRDSKFAALDQWSISEKGYLERQGRNALVFPIIHRVLKVLTGYQRKSRLAFKVDPVESMDTETANQLSGLLMWIAQYGNFYNRMSDGFEGALRCAMTMIDLWVDYSEDPFDGDIRMKVIPYNRILIDPNASERDLSDCRYLLRREYITKEQAHQLLPDRKKDIDSLNKMSGYDRKYKFYIPAKGMLGDDLMAWDEFFVRTSKSVEYMVDPQGNVEPMLFEGTSEQRKEYKQQGVQFHKFNKPTVEQRILLNGEVMYAGEQIDGLEDYSSTPIICFLNPEINESEYRLQSVVRVVRDAQVENNKRISKMVDILDKMIHAGWIAEDGSVVSESSLYQSGQGKVIWTVEGGIEKVKPITNPDIPQGLFQLNQIFQNMPMEVLGITDEMLGQTPDGVDVSVIVAKMRQAAGLTTSQDMFDNYRWSKKQIGNKTLKLVRANWSVDKIKRVLGEEPTKEFYKENFGKYDCVPTEGYISDVQKNMNYAELMSLKNKGAPIPWSAIIDAAPLESKKKLAEYMKQEEESAQLQAKKQQKLEDLQIAAVMKAMEEDEAMSHEKNAQAIENYENAKLNKVKQVREIQKILKETQNLDAKGLKDIATTLNLLHRINQPVNAEAQQISQPTQQPVQNAPQNTKFIR